MSETVDGRYFHYPSKFYSAEYTDSSFQNGTSTSYIWAGDTLIAYVERPIVSGSPSGTAKTYYVHQDHLESTNVVTDSTGSVVTFKDYLPYGSTRTESGPGELSRGYIAQFENEGNDLSYLNARYYEGSRGQFLSQDPVFWEIGQTKDGKIVLENPQAQNSYSYAVGNPITLKDPTGRIAPLIPLLTYILFGYGLVDTGVTLYEADIMLNQYPGQFTVQEKNLVRAKSAFGLATLLAPYTTVGGKVIMSAADDFALGITTATLDTLDTYAGDRINKYIRNPKTINPSAISQALFGNSGNSTKSTVTGTAGSDKKTSGGTNSSIRIDSGTRQLLQQLKQFMTPQAQRAFRRMGI